LEKSVSKEYQVSVDFSFEIYLLEMEAPYSPRRGLDSMKRHQDLYKKTPDWKRKYKGRILFFHLAMSGIISGMFQDARRHDFERTPEKDLNCTAR